MFKKFGGEMIPYNRVLKNFWKRSNSNYYNWFDSVQMRRKTTYAITIMLYNTDIKKVLMLFSLESCAKIRDTQSDFIKKHNTYMMLCLC
jgi:hypothetical protein